MAPYLGDFTVGATLHFQWSTNDGAGGSVTRAANGTVQVYKNNGTTQSTAGVTDTEDFDTLTGVHACTITTGSDGTFYSAGANFTVVLAAATIDGQVVNTPLAHFSIENRSVTLVGIATAVLEEVLTGHSSVANSLAQRLTRIPNVAAGANGGLPTVNGSNYIAGLQGTLNTLDALDTAQDTQHSTTQGLVTTVDTVVDAIKLKTDNLPSDPADQSLVIAATDAILAILGTPAGASLAADIATRLATSGYTAPPTAVQNADALLGRNIAGGSSSGRLVSEALARLRNRVGIVAGTMTVYAANDTSVLWTAAVTTAAGNPVSDVDPA